MPTIFGHAVAGIALGSTLIHKPLWLRTGILCLFCALAPDLDAIGFKLGIPYGHWLGHRGFSHSILFAAVLGMTASLFIPADSARTRGLHFGVFFSCAVLHDILDAMTNGGLGVALFSPFSHSRYFLPWQPIAVSPLSLQRFLTPRGWLVLQSELVWVVAPSLCFMALTLLVRKGWRHPKDRIC